MNESKVELEIAEASAEEQESASANELGDLEAPNIFAEFFLFLKEEKVWWMAPMLVVLLLAGVLIVFGQTVPALAPFIYAGI
ncbi:MAG: DUF5989 family protein [Planctomycetota bacterium]|jgi:hypothetical protein|nr:DUF5989 family protein [Planctomycetota bacterium]MDP6504521.1 DUF5989 family protein [Planctomycetota bacterium]